MVFKPGQSGNPQGRRKGQEFLNALKRQLDSAHDLEISVLPHSYTKLDSIAMKLVQKAQEGETAAIKEIADRLDGKPEASVSVEHSGSVAHEHEGIPVSLGWLGEIRGKDPASTAEKPVLN